jgi:hypothetical protein
MGDPMASRPGPQVFVVIVTQLVTPPLPLAMLRGGGLRSKASMHGPAWGRSGTSDGMPRHCSIKRQQHATADYLPNQLSARSSSPCHGSSIFC